MRFLKTINEHSNAENYQESGLEGVLAKDVLLNIYPGTFEKVLEDFDKQCESDEFKNRNLGLFRSLITFYMKYHGDATEGIKALAIKYNIE